MCDGSVSFAGALVVVGVFSTIVMGRFGIGGGYRIRTGSEMVLVCEDGMMDGYTSFKGREIVIVVFCVCLFFIVLYGFGTMDWVAIGCC